MDDATSPKSVEPSQADEIARAFGRHRDELRSFLAARQKRLSTAEAKLTTQFQHVADQLAQAQLELQHTQREQASRGEQLALEAQSILELKQMFETAQTQWTDAQQRAAEQQRQWAERVEASQKALAQHLEELAGREAQVVHAESLWHDELTETNQQLQSERDALRARIEQSDQRLDEIQQRLEEAVSSSFDGNNASSAIESQCFLQLKEMIEAAQSQWAEVRSESSEQQNEWADRIEAGQKALAQRIEELAAGEAQAVRVNAQRHDELAKINQRLESERDELENRVAQADRRLAELQRQLDNAEPSNANGEDYRSRYELAIEEVHKLSEQNDMLAQELANIRRGTISRNPETAEAADWEAQKRRLLEALENLDENNEKESAERIEIETVIQTTNAVIAAKDQEIAQLRRAVGDHAGEKGTSSAGAPSIDKVLDQDEIIQQEREKFRQLQNELEGKLRQAEIELSIERADIARQRIEVEEIMRQFAESGSPANADAVGTTTDDKPSGRRWLARLGLKKQDGDDA
ncbi:MAG: hypothetical protein JW719_13035 [Pirellulales bacterium]|nr:hypothetical protein [Pirellulales bacterium]